MFLSSLSPRKEDGPTLANISETSVTYPAYKMLGLQQQKVDIEAIKTAYGSPLLDISLVDISTFLFY